MKQLLLHYNDAQLLYTCNKGICGGGWGCWMVRGRRRGSNVERQLIAVHSRGDRERDESADWRSTSYSDDTLLSMLDIDRTGATASSTIYIYTWPCEKEKKANNRKWIVPLLL